MIRIFMENNFVFGVHLHNLFSYGNKTWKHKRKSEKACLLRKKIIACPSNPKVLLKIQNHQNWPQSGFFCLKTSPSMMLPVLAFLGSKNVFFD